MAEDSGQERTEQPTPKRLKEAREKGQIARSRELGTTLALLLSALSLLLLGRHTARQFEILMHSGLSLPRSLIMDPNRICGWFAHMILHGLWLCSPLFGVLMVAAVASNMALGGVAFSGQSLMPKPEKLNPLRGLGRIFSSKGLMELGKALTKFTLVAGVALLVLRSQAATLLGLGRQPLGDALAQMASLLAWGFLWLAGSLVLVAAVDVPFQLWDHNRNLKMTQQELRDELKETEGNPEVKGRLRRLQREMSQRRMMEAVPTADVVLTNPTHYAVALAYDDNRMGAPRVVAKGADLVAFRLRDIAREAEVPVMEMPPLARAIYHNTPLDGEIPRALYVAVAQVLAYVYQLRAGLTPETPPEVDVPDELLTPKGSA